MTNKPAIAPKRTDGISICIPNWNHRNYLCRSIGCALATAKALARHGVGCEVLVLDDCSRDGSQRLMLRLAMMDPTGFLHAVAGTENCGLGAMRTRCVVESRYKWVCFLDADNELIPDNLFQFYLAAQQTGAALVYGNVIVKGSGSGEPVQKIFSNEVPGENLLERNFIDTMAVVDAEQAIAVGGFAPQRNTPEDWEFLLHLIAEGRQIVFVPLVIGIYYQEEMSLSQDRGEIDFPRIRRQFNQRRVGLPADFRPRMYHPDLGDLIESAEPRAR
jgi:glycosyltransferase involved in cell wall biosynthesis